MPDRRTSIFSDSPPRVIPTLPFPSLVDNIEEVKKKASFSSVSRGDIQPKALLAIRDTFLIQCERGALKRPVIHVSFTYPRNLRECCTCGDTDFLFVYVGLCNIFVLQFVVVILIFFVDKEVDFGSLESYYPGYFSAS